MASSSSSRGKDANGKQESQENHMSSKFSNGAYTSGSPDACYEGSNGRSGVYSSGSLDARYENG